MQDNCHHLCSLFQLIQEAEMHPVKHNPNSLLWTTGFPTTWRLPTFYLPLSFSQHQPPRPSWSSVLPTSAHRGASLLLGHLSGPWVLCRAHSLHIPLWRSSSNQPSPTLPLPPYSLPHTALFSPQHYYLNYSIHFIICLWPVIPTRVWAPWMRVFVRPARPWIPCTTTVPGTYAWNEQMSSGSLWHLQLPESFARGFLGFSSSGTNY